MDHIISVEGQDLQNLLDLLEEMAVKRGKLYQLRVTVDGDQVKFKANGQTWTTGFGSTDPTCRVGQERAARERGRAAARRELEGQGGGIGCFPPA